DLPGLWWVRQNPKRSCYNIGKWEVRIEPERTVKPLLLDKAAKARPPIRTKRELRNAWLLGGIVKPYAPGLADGYPTPNPIRARRNFTDRGLEHGVTRLTHSPPRINYGWDPKKRNRDYTNLVVTLPPPAFHIKSSYAGRLGGARSMAVEIEKYLG